MEGERAGTATFEFSEKQLQIMEAAEKLFADRGFAGASVRDIARAAGINLAMISYYFGSKEALLKAIVEYRMASAASMMRSVMEDRQKSPVEKLDMLLDNYVERILSHPHFNRMMIREQLSRDMDWFRSLVKEVKKNNGDLFRQLLDQGRRKGLFRQVAVPLMMATIIGTLHQILAMPDSIREFLKATDLSNEAYEARLICHTKEHLRMLVHSMLIIPETNPTHDA